MMSLLLPYLRSPTSDPIFLKLYCCKMHKVPTHLYHVLFKQNNLVIKFFFGMS